MKIVTLMENTARGDLTPLHGLSLYMETAAHKLLFDVGPDGEALFSNAQKLGIDLTQVDTVILSHGHRDHGGGLEYFLARNRKAKIYIQRRAFAPHYRVLPMQEPVYNGLDAGLAEHPQMVLLEGDYDIDSELSLFTVPAEGRQLTSEANGVLYEEDAPDSFLHEQSLIVRGERPALIMGCGHTGVVNILQKAADAHPVLCIGGYHLMNPTTKQPVSQGLMSRIAEFLGNYPQVTFYTCHCTGQAAYTYLSQRLSNMKYLSCGDIIEA